MQTITPALEALLKSKLQVGTGGYRTRFEVDSGIPVHDFPEVVSVTGGTYSDPAPGPSSLAVTLPTTQDGDLLLMILASRYGGDAVTPSGWTTVHAQTVLTEGYLFITSLVCDGTEGGTAPVFASKALADQFNAYHLVLLRGAALWGVEVAGPTADATTAPTLTPSWGSDNTLWMALAADSHGALSGSAFTYPTAFTLHRDYKYTGGFEDIELAIAMKEEVTASQAPGAWGPTWQPTLDALYTVGIVDLLALTTATFQPKSVSIDKSLRMTADQAEVEFANEALPLGWGASSIFTTNARCRIFQWYGEDANEIQVFEGLIDRVRDHRDVLTTSVSLRDLMAILIDQTFSATAPQETGETGAVRTAANGVYLSMEVSDIVEDILDRAGWPTADRAITETSYVLDEFIVPDGASWAETIIGDSQLTGLVGYSAWADELGVFHFAPTLISQNLTDPETPAYTFRSGEDVVSLDDETDQYELRTRVKVRGPLTTTTLQDTWRELWRTSKFHRPVGLWHDPADAANLRVLDRGTKRLYKLRQSDRVVLSSVSVSSICPHPLGLSGDPADASVYWLLNAPWIDGISGGNRVKKVRKSDNHVLATFSLPSGRWSALKVSSSYLYLTNLDTDRFYRRSKSDGSAIANYSHTYNSVVQANPSGLMINGTTLYLFWANGGTTARFLVCQESAPGTVTDVVKTAGTALHGGEMDTVTDIDCYGDSDSLGLVAKFTLAMAVDQTTEVFAEVVDTDLEDELGSLAQMESREHDTHTADADHPYEVRRLTLDLSVITSLAQATQTAQRQLDIASQRRRVVDVGIVGNPALQKTDLVAVIDPVTGLSTGFAIDTYRTSMSADGTYLGTMALFPIAPVTDDPDDEGNAGS